MLGPSPANVGIRCRHHRKVLKRLRLCRRCRRAWLLRADPARLEREDRRALRRRAAARNARVRAEQRRHADRRAWPARDRRLRRRYGLTLRRYLRMYRRLRGRCWVCFLPMTRAHLDHDHTTGRVRGVLCYRCNRGLALFADDWRRVRRAAAYLASTFDGRRDDVPAPMTAAEVRYSGARLYISRGARR